MEAEKRVRVSCIFLQVSGNIFARNKEVTSGWSEDNVVLEKMDDAGRYF